MQAVKAQGIDNKIVYCGGHTESNKLVGEQGRVPDDGMRDLIHPYSVAN